MEVEPYLTVPNEKPRHRQNEGDEPLYCCVEILANRQAWAHKVQGCDDFGKDTKPEKHETPLRYKNDKFVADGAFVHRGTPVRRRVITAKLVEVRKSIHIVDTISFSGAGRPMSSVLTKVNGARGSSESASLPSERSFVGLEVNSLCSVKRRILERKKKEFWMLGKIATMLAISVLPRIASAPIEAPMDS